jgi:hypothetical protein
MRYVHLSIHQEFLAAILATIPSEDPGMVFFDLNKLRMAGFRRFKLLRVMPGGITGF